MTKQQNWNLIPKPISRNQIKKQKTSFWLLGKMRRREEIDTSDLVFSPILDHRSKTKPSHLTEHITILHLSPWSNPSQNFFLFFLSFFPNLPTNKNRKLGQDPIFLPAHNNQSRRIQDFSLFPHFPQFPKNQTANQVKQTPQRNKPFLRRSLGDCNGAASGFDRRGRSWVAPEIEVLGAVRGEIGRASWEIGCLL